MTEYTMHKNKVSYRTLTNKTAYTYNEEKKYKWLQKICLRTLNKLGCYYQHEEQTVTRVKINVSGLIDFIIAQRREVLEEAHHMRDSLVVYLGDSEYSRFQKDSYNYIQMVNTKGRYGMNGKIEFMDMEVVLIPHWEGVLVAPRSKI